MNKNPEIPVAQLSQQGQEAFGDFLRAIFGKFTFVPAAILTFFNGDELVGEVRLDYQDPWTNHDGKNEVTIASDNSAIATEFTNRWASVLLQHGVESIKVETPQKKRKR